jgi:Na+-transporting NADH:ubiquinone oxidoreductase subunit C
MSVDSLKNTLKVAFGVCLVSSVLVSSAAVELKPLQDANKKRDKISNILAAGNIPAEGKDVFQVYKEIINPRVVNVETGEFVPDEKCAEELKPENFDIRRIANIPEYSRPLSQSQDIAGIKKQPKFMVVYEVMKKGEVEKYILPIYGKGLWSTLYGFLALDKDFKTIDGFTFYEHGETPGLGGEVDNPRWKAEWRGKLAYDDDGNVIIRVIKGKVDPNSPEANHQIDGLSGATLTTRGVDNLVRFWLGDMGYKTLVTKLKEGEMNE